MHGLPRRYSMTTAAPKTADTFEKFEVSYSSHLVDNEVSGIWVTGRWGGDMHGRDCGGRDGKGKDGGRGREGRDGGRNEGNVMEWRGRERMVGGN